MPEYNEKVLVIRNDRLFGKEFWFDGFNNNPKHLFELQNSLSHFCEVMEHGPATEKLNYKQPIPYVVVQIDDKIFMYERLSGGGEKGLHNKLSIGVGGHMNAIPNKSFDEVLLENLHREINEEVYIECENEPELEIIGFINDDKDAVGKVHIGILYLMKYKNATISVNEKKALKGYELLTYDEILNKKYFERLENWSKIALVNF